MSLFTLIFQSWNYQKTDKTQDGPRGFQDRNRGFEPIKDAVRTITTDNRTEFVQYDDIEKSLRCSVYYAHSHRL